MIYAMCTESQRNSLWNSIYNLANINLPWLIGRDFNTLLNEEEKIKGLPITLQQVEDFAFYVNSCGLEEITFKGSPSLGGMEEQEVIVVLRDQI